METHKSGIPTIQGLTDTYNKQTGNNISAAMMKFWLGELGYKLEIRPVIVPLHPQPPQVSLPKIQPRSEEDFEDDITRVLAEPEPADEEDLGFGKPPRLPPMEDPNARPTGVKVISVFRDNG